MGDGGGMAGSAPRRSAGFRPRFDGRNRWRSKKMKQQIRTTGRNGWVRAASVAAALLVLVTPLVLSVADEEDDDESVRNAYRYVISDDENSKRAYLGVNIEEETDHPDGGARVVRVVEESPAEEAGVLKGDVIVGLEAETIRGPGALGKKLREYEAGDTVALKVLRDGDTVTLTVVLGSRPRWTGFIVGDGEAWTAPFWGEEDAERYRELAEEYAERAEEWAEQYGERWQEWAERHEDDDWYHGLEDFRFSLAGGRPKLGVQLVDTTAELREHLGGREDAGVLVGKVLSDMPAEKAGMQVGDLIVSVNGATVKSSGDLIRALRDVAGETIQLEVVRDGRLMTLDTFIPEPDEDEATGPRAMLAIPPLPEMPAMPELPPLPDVEFALPEMLVLPDVEDLPEMRRELREVQRRIREQQRAVAAAQRATLRAEREARDEALRGLAEERRAQQRELREQIREERRRAREASRAYTLI
jgi:membrane-associated protease RseP (regulator of RpoE activity)